MKPVPEWHATTIWQKDLHDSELGGLEFVLHAFCCREMLFDCLFMQSIATDSMNQALTSELGPGLQENSQGA